MPNNNENFHGPKWFAIGIENAKFGINAGGLWRSAAALGAAYIFTIGARFGKERGDTSHSWRQIPALSFTDINDFAAHIPYQSMVVGVEINDHSVPLETFNHPNRCLYLLGPEDGSLSEIAQGLCSYTVQIQSSVCLNVATAGSIVMYDRQAKSVRHS